MTSLDPDPRNADLLAAAHLLGLAGVAAIEVADVYFVDADLDDDARQRLTAVLVDPLLQQGTWGAPVDDPTTTVIETALLPGVTDSVATAVVEAAATLRLGVHQAATGRRYVVRTVSGTPLDDDTRRRIATRLLSNAVIERVSIGPIEPLFAHASTPAPAEVVPVRGLDDTGLAELNRARGMALDPAELRAIATWFDKVGRDPTDVELETLAQTWSEHCAHKTFRARVILPDGTERRSLLSQLRDATERIDAPFVRSAFVGNAGIVSFTPGTTVAVKAETHNHPSAIEPFGGANTGVGGVIRDVMGAAHHPIACTDVLCFGPSDLAHDQVPPGVIHPQLVRDGVVAGVADYGNKIGLPTVAGAVLYDPGFTANPLVFCGCVGVGLDVPPLTGPHPDDLVVVLGGRTGRDGLRGATFSSATMDATTGDVAGASVQIGDPITEKLLIDLLRDAGGCWSAITDCGAGGLSSAVGEMAEGTGAEVDLALAPLKYPGLAPWEIWLSEAQERMVVAVPPDRLSELQRHARRHGVEATVLGRFTGDAVLRVRHGGDLVLELDTAFLHDGRPGRALPAELPAPRRDGAIPRCDDPTAALLDLLAHPNIASKEAIIRRYDHEIRGTTVVRPLVGVGGDAPADGVVLAEPRQRTGLAIGHGVNPWYGVADPARMAAAVVDEALRNVVAVGADPDHVALMDNFSWGDPRRPSTFGELVVAVDAICAASIAHAAPFVSGKDSLNNEYLGADGERHGVPPTLVITAVAHVPDADAVVTPDLKRAGDVLVLIGATAPEFGGSHLGAVLGGFDDPRSGTVPDVDPQAPARYRALHRALGTGRVRACHDVSEGGLAVAVTEMAIGGRLGVRVDTLPHDDVVVALFAESTGRFVCEIEPGDVEWLAEALDEPVHVLGMVTDEPVVHLGPCRVAVADAARAFGAGSEGAR
ncbi:MAG: phosphoribosylformylglycinamidine synthase subunit PurL [Acidimicrobiaceae bacterium]|nr:phosphoribosylformylglycinamidine synthase subunit PurL [Acidimicrobiaceae bacterium]